MLFGDNITKQIKDITDDNKVTDKVLDHNRKMSSRGKRGSYRGRGNTRGNYTTTNTETKDTEMRLF